MNANFFAHPTAVIDEGCRIGAGTKVWHFSHLMAGAVIGENCLIGQNVFVADQVQIGNNVINPRSAVSRKGQYKKTIIKKGATIGANATIVCGNEIEKYAFIGAGAVVTKPVMAYALVIGNPARQTGWVSEYGHALQFDGDGKAVCCESGAIYQLQDGRMLRFPSNSKP